jgi:peroxiredoxin
MIRRFRPEAEKEVRLRGLKGARAPGFTLKNLAGKEETLAAYRGKIILLNFFANW